MWVACLFLRLRKRLRYNLRVFFEKNISCNIKIYYICQRKAIKPFKKTIYKLKHLLL